MEFRDREKRRLKPLKHDLFTDAACRRISSPASTATRAWHDVAHSAVGARLVLARSRCCHDFGSIGQDHDGRSILEKYTALRYFAQRGGIDALLARRHRRRTEQPSVLSPRLAELLRQLQQCPHGRYCPSIRARTFGCSQYDR